MISLINFAERPHRTGEFGLRETSRFEVLIQNPAPEELHSLVDIG